MASNAHLILPFSELQFNWLVMRVMRVPSDARGACIVCHVAKERHVACLFDPGMWLPKERKGKFNENESLQKVRVLFFEKPSLSKSSFSFRGLVITSIYLEEGLRKSRAVQ